MMTIDLNDLLEKLLVRTKEVGELQMERLGASDLAIDTKSTGVDFVTEMDKKSEELIIAFIKSHYPDHSILAEESGHEQSDSPYQWIIDPIDGTTNYKHGYPIFNISIALAYQGDVVLGLVYVPPFKQAFYAIKGEGSYCNGRPLKVSVIQHLSEALLSTGFPYDKKTNPENNLNYFNALVPQLAGIRRSGSAAFDLIQVAAGNTDGYWERYVNRWDIAAGILIIKEAGGTVHSYDNGKFYSVIATNGHIQKELTQVIASVNSDLFGL